MNCRIKKHSTRMSEHNNMCVCVLCYKRAYVLHMHEFQFNLSLMYVCVCVREHRIHIKPEQSITSQFPFKMKVNLRTYFLLKVDI